MIAVGGDAGGSGSGAGGGPQFHAVDPAAAIDEPSRIAFVPDEDRVMAT